MADNEPTISMAGINAPPLYRLVEDGDKTVIVTADTNTPMWVINGKIGGDTVETMTTEERTAITPEAGQLIFDTTLGILFVGDGSTVGGTAVGGGGGGGVVPGYRLTDDGTSLNFNPVQPIVSVVGSSVTLVPDTAYKMYATTGALNVTANPPAANYWGLEGHAEIFVGSVGYVVFDTSKIVLANQLEPDSVNNCTLRFHDGMCYVSVEDHIAGYIVVNGSTSGDGSLYYGITTSTNDYVAFDASLNGSTLDMAGAVTNGEKHLVGNGYTETTLTGAVDCGTSKFTVANLSLQDVLVTGGTMTLGDAYIPSGSTVAVIGGGLAVEKVTGNGGVINLGGKYVNANSYSVNVSGCTFTGGSNPSNGGAFYLSKPNNTFTDCIISSNSAGQTGGAMYIGATASGTVLAGSTITGNHGYYANGGGIADYAGATYSNCVLSGNVDRNGDSGDLMIRGGTATVIGGKYGLVIPRDGATMAIASNCTFDIISPNGAPSGYITISSGASINLTSSIFPGGTGGIQVVGGTCTVNGNVIESGTYTRIDSNGQPT